MEREREGEEGNCGRQKERKPVNWTQTGIQSIREIDNSNMLVFSSFFSFSIIIVKMRKHPP